MGTRLPLVLNGPRRAGRSAFIKIRCLFRLGETVETAEIAAIGDTDAQVAQTVRLRLTDNLGVVVVLSFGHLGV